jgi:phenylacetic acid degradation operon negative regulatory protein
MAHEDGTIAADELFPVAVACGQSAEQVRSCLRRLVREGYFVRHGSGSTARYDATEKGLAALGATTERTRLAYVQDDSGKGWDRQWRLVAFAIPEERRSARDAFRDALLDLGGAPVQGGLYVSAHNWIKAVQDEAGRLDVAELVSTAVTDDLNVGGVKDPRELARKLWPVDDLRQRYEAFVDRYRSLPDMLESMRSRKERLPDTEFLPGALSMAVDFRECFERDPLLPPELLPRPWPGRQARDLLRACRFLALGLRQAHGRPALFHLYDEAIRSPR